MNFITTILAELEQEAVATGKLLERVPADKLQWKPHPKSMTLGAIALHVATDAGLIAQTARQSGITATELVTHPEAESKEQILNSFTASIQTAKEILPTLSEEMLATNWAVTDGERTLLAVPRTALLRVFMLNHWYHHRGQLTVYLRLLDVPLPSVYGPSADENPFA